jgi:hypothetical protein
VCACSRQVSLYRHIRQASTFVVAGAVQSKTPARVVETMMKTRAGRQTEQEDVIEHLVKVVLEDQDLYPLIGSLKYLGHTAIDDVTTTTEGEIIGLVFPSNDAAGNTRGRSVPLKSIKSYSLLFALVRS